MTDKELEKLARVCRKYGITEYIVEGVKLKFDPYVPSISSPSSSKEDKPQTSYSEEEMMFWSSSPPISE